MRPTSSQVALLGIRIDDVPLDEAVCIIDSMIESGGCHRVAAVSAGFLNEAADDHELREILDGCDVVLADGMPRVWASRWVDAPLKHRISAADLFPRLLEIFARNGRRIFLMGPTEARSSWTRERIQQEHPDADICGCLAPPEDPLDTVASGEVLRLIENAKPDVLMVAFGDAGQEKWLARHSHRLRVPVCIGVGASADFFSSRQSRIPVWIRRSSGEGLIRRFSEPLRSGTRSLDRALFLLRHVSTQLFLSSVQPSKRTAMEVPAARAGRARRLSYRRSEQE
jgi:N-acetylglucosaminyldiphosphoundecaprenol N-acetyl-beta-D-mannosaminyltransferase